MLESSLVWILAYRYWVILPLTIVEGPVIMLLCGFFIRLGGLALIPTYFLLMFGDFIGDVFWYWVGRYGARSLMVRFGHFFSISIEDIERFEKTFYNHQVKILFISKITMGLGFAVATLMAAGAAHVPFKKYALVTAAGGFVWTAILVSIGYFFGNAYLTIGAGLRDVFIGAVIIIVLLALRGLAKYFRKRYATHS